VTGAVWLPSSPHFGWHAVAWVLSTGGTISGLGSSPTDLSNYRSGGVLGEEVVKGVPQISQFATVKVDQIVNVGSLDITTENWLTSRIVSAPSSLTRPSPASS
jgi:L-asparaginase/Glu-tRNA(Gln) amidotransferase subunit D